MVFLPQILNDLPARAGARLREATTSAALLLAAALLFLVGVGLALAALYLWLSSFWPDYLAALATAGVPFLVGVLLVVRVMTTGRRSTGEVPGRTAEADLSASAEQAGTAAARETLSELQANPAGVLAGALVVGVMAGLLSPSSRD